MNNAKYWRDRKINKSLIHVMVNLPTYIKYFTTFYLYILSWRNKILYVNIFASFFPSLPLTTSNRFVQYASYKAPWNLSRNVDLNRTECDR